LLHTFIFCGLVAWWRVEVAIEVAIGVSVVFGKIVLLKCHSLLGHNLLSFFQLGVQVNNIKTRQVSNHQEKQINGLLQKHSFFLNNQLVLFI